MKKSQVGLTLAVCLMVVGIVTACGALGWLSEPLSGPKGAVKGLQLGVVSAIAIAVVHTTRVIFGRSPEAKGPKYDIDSVEQYRLKIVAGQTFADVMILLGLAVAASASVIADTESFIVLSIVLVLAACDFFIRIVASKRRGL